METCPISQCKDKDCKLRHPRFCRFFFQFGKCKFDDDCAYLHESTQTNLDDEIKNLKSEVDQIKSRNTELEKILLSMKSEIAALKEVCTKAGNEPSDNFPCEECDYKASSRTVLKRHTTMKHRVTFSKNSTPTSSISISESSQSLPSSSILASISNSSTSTSNGFSRPPVPCSRNFYGCPNLVTHYDQHSTAMCPTCKLMIASKLNANPFPSNLCPSCHESSCGPPFSFCSECLKDLMTDNFIDSRWGAWQLDKETEEIICIDLDFN